MTFNPSVVTEPTYQLTALQEVAAKLESEGHSIINATIGDPKDNTPDSIRLSAIQSLNDTHFSQYPSYIGLDKLREEMVMWAKRKHQVDLNPADHVITCNGTKEAIFSLPLLFDWTQNETILMPSLSYPVYQRSASILSIPTIELPVSETHQFLPQLDQIPVETLKKTQLFWVNSPHNPTSTIAPKSFFEQLISLAETYDFLVCSDECYNDLYLKRPPASVLDIDSTHWVCFRSLSKRSHMTGYRSGGIFSKNKTLIKHLKKLRSPMGIGTPTFIQHAAIWAWQNDEHVEYHRQLYNQKRQQLKAALVSAGLHVFGGDAGFYMWVRSDKHSTSESLAKWFLDRHILVTPGTVFGANGNPYIRLVFCLKNDVINELCNNLQI